MRFPTRTVVMWKIVFSGLLWHHGFFVLSTSNVHAQRGDPFGRTCSSQNKRPHLILEKLGKQAVKMPSWDRPGTPHHDRHPPLHCSGNSSPLGHHSICQQSSLGSTKTIPSAGWTNLKVPMETVPSIFDPRVAAQKFAVPQLASPTVNWLQPAERQS